MSKRVKQVLPLITSADMKILKSYVAQSYLYKKYSALRTDTKDIVAGVFEKINTNIIIVDDKTFVQKITRTQRRFDSATFIEWVKKSGDSELIDKLELFYKSIPTIEFKPFNADYDVAIKKDVRGFDVK